MGVQDNCLLLSMNVQKRYKNLLPAEKTGQEYLDDLYEIARSRNDPLLLESLESFLAATVEGLLQKQSDNEKLDTALKHATEKNSAIALELEAEMEHQVAMLEEKIRTEEKRKLNEQKQEANQQLNRAQCELKEMENKVKELEDQIEIKKNEANIPEVIIEEIQYKEKENQMLQGRLLELQTQMALMRTEVAEMKGVYDEQVSRLASERGAILSCVGEQENLTRQLQLLHEANKRLHDTNDDLRSALSCKRNSLIADENCQFQRSASFMLPKTIQNSPFLCTSFRSDPGAHHSKTGSLISNNGGDTDDDSKQSMPYDDEEDIFRTPVKDNEAIKRSKVNQTPLLAELMAADESFVHDTPVFGDPYKRYSVQYSPANSTMMESPVSMSDRESFVKQLEILCNTNRRLGESNDELRDALMLLSQKLRSEDNMKMMECRSAPVTPYKLKYPNEERPKSTSSPRKVLLTKSGYQPVDAYSPVQPNEFVGDDDMEDEELVRLVDQTNEEDLSVSLSEEPIYIERKIIEPMAARGIAAGADTPDDTASSGRATPDRTYKLVLAGDAAVGKSSFIIRLCKNKFYSALNSTLGVDFQMKTLSVDGKRIALQLWDTAGQERFRSIAKSYFRRVDGVILLYDVTCENSFMDVRDWLESIESSSSKEIPIIICGNKTDLRNEYSERGMPVVSKEQGEKMAGEVGALFIETSAKDGININKACMELARKLEAANIEEDANETIDLEKEKTKKKSSCCS